MTTYLITQTQQEEPLFLRFSTPDLAWQYLACTLYNERVYKRSALMHTMRDMISKKEFKAAVEHHMENLECPADTRWTLITQDEMPWDDDEADDALTVFALSLNEA